MEPGDQVLADRGFTISDDIACYGASLIILSFTEGRSQLTQKEVEQSKQISSSNSCGKNNWKEMLHNTIRYTQCSNDKAQK